jgi:hypothetical protein
LLNNSLKKIIVILSLFCGFSSTGYAEYERPINWTGNIYKIINDYQKIHKTFFKQVCSPSDPSKYIKLIKRYRGQGYYLPKVGMHIDRLAIIKNLHHFKKKIKYIEVMIKRLEKQKNYPDFAFVRERIDMTVSDLLALKKQHYLALSTEKKESLRLESNHRLNDLKKQFQLFSDQIFFMKSYNYPNDFLSSRRDFEKYKDLKGKKNKLKANEIFFFRKIIEDGAYDPNRTKPDKFIRSALDTLELKLIAEKNFISEKFRYDLGWVEKKISSIVVRGKRVQLSRLKEWLNRTQSNFKFYQELVSVKNNKKADFLIKKENEATLRLKEFVYKKQADAYNFWAKQPELYKALFSLETILVHEVGVIDGEYGLERRSVTEVVLNRYHDDFYNKLEPDQPIVEYISDDIDQDDEKWLNVLFKIGEFSFTYHYITAVSGIFCPDMSRRGRAIRAKNLKIALKTIKRHNGSFNAFRYFSRISMFGKIDMSSVWTEYVRLPEIPGNKSSHQLRLQRHYLTDNYQYLYSFFDRRKVEYQVIKIKDTTYSMRWEKGKPLFYDYRNPHLFAYFSKIIN